MHSSKTNSVVKALPRSHKFYFVRQQIPCLYGTQIFITMLKETHQWMLLTLCIHSHNLCYNLCYNSNFNIILPYTLVLPSYPLFEIFLEKWCNHNVFFQYVLYTYVKTLYLKH